MTFAPTLNASDGTAALRTTHRLRLEKPMACVRCVQRLVDLCSRSEEGSQGRS